MNIMIIDFVFSLLFFPGLQESAQGKLLADQVAKKYETALRQVFAYQEKFKILHPMFENLYPIAVVEEGTFFVFAPQSQEKRYILVASFPTKWPVPKGIRASFPLEEYNNKPVCVVTGEVFDSAEGYVFVFHEFVHCHQFSTSEQTLKEKLQVYRNALKKKDFGWELEHPFPYADQNFDSTYARMLEALDSGEAETVLACRRELRRVLRPENYEYMIWQEWKEGLARHLENRMRALLGLPQNQGGLKKPYNRITFYAVGDRLIGFLERRNTALTLDLERLFKELAELGGLS